MNRSGPTAPAPEAPDVAERALSAIPAQSPPGESRAPRGNGLAGANGPERVDDPSGSAADHSRGEHRSDGGRRARGEDRAHHDERPDGQDRAGVPGGAGGSRIRTASRAGAAPATGVTGAGRAGRLRFRPWRLLPTPTGTPFTFGYALVLVATSLFTEYADPDVVSSLLRGSSTDVAHLAQSPFLVLIASALWVAGGITSPYAIGFLLVLTALERRIGGLRTAGVFLLGHAVATLATEVPVGLSVLAGHLPDSSLHRLDYGISFGVAASVGALAGLLTPWLRWAVLAGFGWMLVDDLIAFTDPMTNWGHLLALVIGVSTWPLLRRRPGGGAARTDA